MGGIEHRQRQLLARQENTGAIRHQGAIRTRPCHAASSTPISRSRTQAGPLEIRVDLTARQITIAT